MECRIFQIRDGISLHHGDISSKMQKISHPDEMNVPFLVSMIARNMAERQVLALSGTFHAAL